MSGFGRANSLSINTGGGLFGNNSSSQGQQSGGLFGSTANASQPQSTGGLFGSTQPAAGATSQPPQSGSLFGGQNQSSQQTNSLFGGLNKPATSTAGAGGGSGTGGLFGGSTTQTQPQQSGGLFGGALGSNTQTQNQNQNQGTSQSGGLFGGLGSAQTQQKPSLFGSTQQQNNTGSLFGNNNAQQPQQQQQQQQNQTSMFGSTQQNQPQQQSSLFGGSMNQNKPFGGGNLTGNLGASTQPIQMQAIESLKGTTRFNDLHPDIQSQIQTIDETLQKHISACEQTRGTLPRSVAEIETVGPDVAYIEKFLSTVEMGLENDSSNIAHLKELTKRDIDEAALSFRAIENQKLPGQFRYGNHANLTASTSKPQPSSSLDEDDPTKPVDLMRYFNTRTDELGNTLQVYQGQIREIEAHLRTMEAGTMEKAQQLTGSRSGPRDQRRELVEALRAIEGAILDSAKKVGQVRDDVTKHTMGNVGAALL